LSLKVTLTFGIAMSLVGVAKFSLFTTIMIIQIFSAMRNKILSIVVGVALVGRMEPNFKL